MHVIQTHVVVEFTVGVRERTVTLKFVRADGGGCVYGLSWEQADELARGLRRPVDDEGPLFVGVRMPNAAYLVPRKLAVALWEALVAKARDAEEQVKAPQLARDQALLMRIAAPFGLSSDRKVQDEAAKEAAHDRDLRRFVKLGDIKSKEAFGRPSVSHVRASLSDRAARNQAVRAALGRILARS